MHALWRVWYAGTALEAQNGFVRAGVCRYFECSALAALPPAPTALATATALMDAHGSLQPIQRAIYRFLEMRSASERVSLGSFLRGRHFRRA